MGPGGACWRRMAGGCVELDAVGALPALTLLALLVGTPVAGVLRCPAADVEDCLRPLDPLTTQHRTILPSYDTTTLTKVCRSFRQMESCLAPLKAVCGVSQSRVYSGVRRARNFLCGHGLQEYGDHKVCMAKDALAAEGRVCNMTSAGQQQNTSPRDKRGTTYTGLCQDADRFMTCVREAVLRHCGGGAALWVENVNSKVFSPLLEGSGCYHKHSNVGIALIFGLTIAVFLLMLIIISILLARRRKRHKNNYTRASLSMLAMSLEDQTNMAPKDEHTPHPCTCKTYICSPQCGKTQTLSKMADNQNHQTLQIQNGRHTSDVITGHNDHSTTYELGKLVVGRESVVEEREEEIDQSSPPCGLGGRGRKRLGGFLHGRKEYYLLTAGDMDWRLEEEEEEEEDRDLTSCNLLGGEDSAAEESDGGGGTGG